MKKTSAQEEFLKKLQRQRRRVTALRLLIFVSFLLLWEASARLGWIDSFIFSSPSDLARTFCQMLSGQDLGTHVAITLGETLLSFLLVMVSFPWQPP